MHEHNHDHAPAHEHHHHHDAEELSKGQFHALKWVLVLTFIYFLVEIIGGMRSGSLALVADGSHMLADSLGIGLSLFAAWLVHRPAPPQKTFGYQRVEILVAFYNALLLIGMSIFIIWQGVTRFEHPEAIQAPIMLLVATGGLIVNWIAIRLLHGGHSHNLNIKGAYLHVLGDLLGAVGTMVAAMGILWLHWLWLDPLISLAIAVLILFNAFELLKDATNVLLEGCPSDINIEEIRLDLLSLTGVEEVHNLHVWNINLQQSVLTAHLEVLPAHFTGEMLTMVKTALSEKFGLSHVTLQLEIAASPADSN